MGIALSGASFEKLKSHPVTGLQVNFPVMTRLALISPYARSIENFRGSLIRELVARNIEVYVFAPDFTNNTLERVRKLGTVPISYPLQRTGMNPFQDAHSIFRLALSLKKIRPDIVLTYQPKANIYGLIAARVAGVPRRVGMVTGLGFAFTPGKASMKKRLLQAIIKGLNKVSFAMADKIFFQNMDDLKEYVDLGLIAQKKAVLLGASGVILDEWPPAPAHFSPFTFTLIARLLAEKGILEFAAAAKQIKRRHPAVRCLLIGPLDTNPGAISERQVHSWVEDGVLEWVPWTDDVRPYLRQTSVYVLPSYYREGVPRSTQEAMAMGCPVITTDAPGCRETVIHGVNGFLVPARDIETLIEAMERFIVEPSLIERMGWESRRLAEERFDAKKINAKIIAHLLE